jgi:hypothetical protein
MHRGFKPTAYADSPGMVRYCDPPSLYNRRRIPDRFRPWRTWPSGRAAEHYSGRISPLRRAIVRRENIVLGVTTAATLWFVTVLGLCFSGGQILLGFAGLFLGMIVIAGLRHVQSRIKQDRQGTLTVVTSPGGPTEEEIRANLNAQRYKMTA